MGGRSTEGGGGGGEGEYRREEEGRLRVFKTDSECFSDVFAAQLCCKLEPENWNVPSKDVKGFSLRALTLYM